MSTTTYSINTIDSDSPAAWMRLPGIKVTQGAQDSGKCRFSVETSDPTALVAALEADGDVVDYHLA